MNKDKIELLKEYLTATHEKRGAIELQQFEAAAEARDKERQLGKEIYHKYISDESSVTPALYSFYDKEVAQYFLLEYNILMPNLTADTIKVLTRSKNLRDLGI